MKHTRHQTYEPHPFPLDDVELEEALMGLATQVAQHAHDVMCHLQSSTAVCVGWSL